MYVLHPGNCMASKLLSSFSAGKLLLRQINSNSSSDCAIYSRAQKCLLPTPLPASQTHHFHQNSDNTEWISTVRGEDTTAFMCAPV